VIAVDRVRRLLWQTRVGDRAVVVTYRENGLLETRVDGGRLDGWVVASDIKQEAACTHREAVRLVRQTESPSGLQLRSEVETMN
jgi:hypothetical protein